MSAGEGACGNVIGNESKGRPGEGAGAYQNLLHQSWWPTAGSRQP